MKSHSLSSNKQPYFQRQSAFTLIELLVVVAIIALLISILLPSLNSARDQARMLKCSANLSSIGKSLYFYADDNNEYVPKGIWRYETENGPRLFYWELLWPYLGLPDAATYQDKLRKLPDAGVFNCPAFKLPAKPGENEPLSAFTPWNKARSYAVNDFIIPPSSSTDSFGRVTVKFPEPLLKIDSVRRPSEACYMADTSGAMTANATGHRDSRLSRTDVALMFNPIPPAPTSDGRWTNQDEAHDPRHRKGKRMNVLYFDGHVTSAGIGDLPPLNDPVSTNENQEDSYYKVHVFWSGEYGNYVPSNP